MTDLITFLNESPSRYHAVVNFGKALDEAGYTRLSEGKAWDLVPGGKYYVTRNGSALLAFRIPKADFTGFMITASHSDAPSFRIKQNAELNGPDNYIRLNTERYGGVLMAPWMDRPLTVSGRVLVQTENAIETRLVYIDKDLLLIPNVAIHMNKEANTGFKYDPKTDSIPLMGMGDAKGAFYSILAEAAGCSEDAILGHDLYLCA